MREHHLLLEHTEMWLSVKERFVMCTCMFEKETHNDVLVLWLSGLVSLSLFTEVMQC